MVPLRNAAFNESISLTRNPTWRPEKRVKALTLMAILEVTLYMLRPICEIAYFVNWAAPRTKF